MGRLDEHRIEATFAARIDSEYRDNEIHLEIQESIDKDFIVIEGRSHVPRAFPAKTPGQYSTAVKNFFY